MSLIGSQISSNVQNKGRLSQGGVCQEDLMEKIGTVSATLKQPQMREVIRGILHKKLEMMNYEADICQNAVKDISETIRSRLKDFKMERYKTIIQTMISEQKNQGLQIVNKCFWDSRVDFSIVEEYKKDSLMCVVIVYFVHFY